MGGVAADHSPLLVPWSWKSRAILLHNLWATTGPVTGTLYTFTYLNYKFVTQMDKFVTVRSKLSEIPPSTSVHYAARVLRNHVVCSS